MKNIHIELNGRPHHFNERITVEDLIKQLDLDEEEVAVEINRDIVKRRNWRQHKLFDGDRVEIVHFVGGG